ncbi:MAG: hypothetical protein AAF310_01650, partial [Myxococcota bacterium]
RILSYCPSDIQRPRTSCLTKMKPSCSIGTDNYVPGSHAWKIKKDPDRWGNNYSICNDSKYCFHYRFSKLDLSHKSHDRWNFRLLSNGNYYIIQCEEKKCELKHSKYMIYDGTYKFKKYSSEEERDNDQENQWIIEEYNEDKKQSAVND